MADSPVNRRSATPSTIPQKRPLGLDDEQHAPAVSSPLNPDFATSRARRPAVPREQREKKESLKKREAKGVDGLRSGTPDSQGHGKKTKKGVETSTTLSPMRYSIAAPKPADFDPPQAPILIPSATKARRQFYKSSEHVYNRKGYRYTHCIADPAFYYSRYHRRSETEPFRPRIDFEDSSSHILLDESATCITTEKGFRMARANVGVREGKWYWECKILSGIEPEPQVAADDPSGDGGGHVRLGWARREASLDTPVGFDAYSYGLRDVAGEKVHMSRPKSFMPAGEEICEGDVVGLEIHLPSLLLHKKVVEGSYNKAVDVSDDIEPQGAETLDIIRDRSPIRFKGQLYFEYFEYDSTKELEELMNPSPVIAATSTSTTVPPNPNHSSVPLRTLPFSCIKVYKNGRYIGTPFTDLLSFLPPASKPSKQPGSSQPPPREGLDDGLLGYFPAASVFRGGSAEFNFGPNFWFPPPELSTHDDDVDMIGDSSATVASRSGTATSLKKLRPVSERYNEQIAEDVVFDIVDEVDFWIQDGGAIEFNREMNNSFLTAPGLIGSTGPSLGLVVADAGVVAGGGQAGQIKEIVQEEE